ncbi:MAG: hypothetical protein V4764_09565 [Burkholderia sp.]
MRQPSPRVCRNPPPFWIALAIYVVVQAAGAAITVLTWGPHPVASSDFFVRLLVLPIALTAALCGIVYSGYAQEANDTDWWNYLCRETHARWRRWAQERVVIVASTSLSPEVELGERMLGLEGSPPANPGKRLPLAGLEQGAGEARLERVLAALLAPLSAAINGIAHTRTMHVCLQSAAQRDLLELKQLWRRLRLPDLVTFSWVSLEVPVSLTDRWLGDDRPSSEFLLTLACQLHTTEQAPAWSEAAVALLTTSSEVMAAYRGTRKPQAYLFRPIVASPDRVMDAIAALLRARQTARERIKHCWASGLTGAFRHATISAIEDNGLDLSRHDLDEAVGEPGPVSRLLLVALAAQMVQHGQGVQLIATRVPRGVQLSLIGTQREPVEPVEPDYYRQLSTPVTVGVMGVVCLMAFGADTLGGMTPWVLWLAVGMAIASLVIQIGGSRWLRNALEDEFYRRLQCAETRS